MLIDHIGLILFPDIIGFRIVGRLAMPLFAYAVARGFYFSKLHGTLSSYKLRMLLFAMISQIPYILMVERIEGNIGVLWLISILFLERLELQRKTVLDYLVILSLALSIVLVPISYGVYGLVFTLVLYYFSVKIDKRSNLLLSYLGLHVFKIVNDFQSGLMQLFTLLCVPLIDVLQRYDHRIRINRLFFYAFYPIHIIVLLVVKAVAF